MKKSILNVKCLACLYLNIVSIIPIYDGFEGDFLCRNCGEPLDNLHAMLEE